MYSRQAELHLACMCVYFNKEQIDILTKAETVGNETMLRFYCAKYLFLFLVLISLLRNLENQNIFGKGFP